ncbi:MAG TPA: SRPBCC family protein [Solirubrobacteraceae bacterium]|jgi:uncharacterized membrane protein|nr:SRPBCC family protein [Solirubrobacteraceae bacterium]
MRLQAEVEIAAPRPAVWAYLTDPGRALHFLAGVTRWEVVGEPDRGLGARYRMLMRVGSADIGGLIEIVEYDHNRDLAWTSVTGLDQRGRWRARDRPGERTTVEFRLSYGVAGAGLGAWIAEHVAAPMVQRNLRRSLAQLKRQVEYEQLRVQAAERRRRQAV